MQHLSQVQHDSHCSVKAGRNCKILRRWFTCTCHSEIDANHDIGDPTISGGGRHGEPLKRDTRAAPSVPLNYRQNPADVIIRSSI